VVTVLAEFLGLWDSVSDIILQHSALRALPQLLFAWSQEGLSTVGLQQTLQELRWIGDTHGEATVTVLAEFLGLWDSVSDIILQHGIQDTNVWLWTSLG
jgi:hypothetical protein